MFRLELAPLLIHVMSLAYQQPKETFPSLPLEALPKSYPLSLGGGDQKRISGEIFDLLNSKVITLYEFETAVN